MIRFLMTRGHEYTLGHLRKDPATPRLEIVGYDRLLRSRWAPHCTHVFTDFDRLDPWALELAAAVYRCLDAAGVRVLNDPARVKTRFALLRALHAAGLNDFNAYRLGEGIWPERYPVFVRRNAGHRFPVSDLLPDRDALERAIDTALEEGVPESSLIVVEYAGQELEPGLYRKLAMQRVGDRYVQQLSGHDGQWLVKYGRQAFAPPRYYEAELEFVRKSPWEEDLRRAFEIAGIEWGRADFGLLDGRVQIFEINTNPHVMHIREHPHPSRLESAKLAFEGVQEGLRAIDGPRGSGARVRVCDRRLDKARRGRDRRVRSRFFP